MKKILFFTIFTGSLLFISGCGTSDNGLAKGFNLFSIQDDISLGKEVAAEIDGNPNEYPLLDSARYSASYAYLYKIRDKILNSGKVINKNEFAWRLRIINDDNTLNAFCTPGGYIYVYTGLMKFLDSEDQLAGVLAHEIGHADLRHSTQIMTKLYGVQVLLEVIAGNRQMIKELTTGLIGLKFSRTHETQADQASVTYMCPTDYNANAAGKFFEKIQAMGGASTPEWLSTHPSPENRIEHFNNLAIELGCTGKNTYQSEYKAMLRTLP